MRNQGAEAEELGALYARYRRQAVARSAHILRDPVEAEDTVQDLFLRLCERPELQRSVRAWGAWLEPVMNRRAINALRSRAQRRRLTHTPEPGCSPEEEAQAQELARAVERALGTLSVQHRKAFTLRELEGLSYAEIARRWGVPEGTVKSALFRARARLRAELGRRGDPFHRA